MAHLHLPELHSTDDLVLAGQIAETFESEDLYVVWTHADGPGAVPSVEALLRDAPPHPLAGALRAFFVAIADVWRALTSPPAYRVEDSPGAASEQRQAA
jgi:hypothetical protein